MTNLNELNRLIKYHRQQIIELKKKVDNINDINIKEAFNLNIKMCTVQLKMLKIYFNKNYNNLDNNNNISTYEEDDIDLEQILNNSEFNEKEENEELEDINKVINTSNNTENNKLYENTEDNEIENIDEKININEDIDDEDNEIENTDEKININEDIDDEDDKNNNSDNSDDSDEDTNEYDENNNDDDENNNEDDENNNEDDENNNEDDENNNETINKITYTKENLLLLNSLKIKELCKLYNSRFFNNKEKCINNLLKKLKE